jgi:hypothetical protein
MPESKGRGALGQTALLSRTVLQELVKCVEAISKASQGHKSFTIPIPITVVVDGQVILGEMIPRAEFVTGVHKCMSDILRQGIKTKDAETDLRLAKQIDAYLEESRRAVADLEKGTVEPGSIWLRKVRFSEAAAFDASVPEPVTEIEIDRISAYWLGYAALPSF